MLALVVHDSPVYASLVHGVIHKAQRVEDGVAVVVTSWARRNQLGSSNIQYTCLAADYIQLVVEGAFAFGSLYTGMSETSNARGASRQLSSTSVTSVAHIVYASRARRNQLGKHAGFLCSQHCARAVTVEHEIASNLGGRGGIPHSRRLPRLIT